MLVVPVELMRFGNLLKVQRLITRSLHGDTAQSSFEPTKTKGMILRNLAKTLKIPQYPSNIPPPSQGVLRDLRNR